MYTSVHFRRSRRPPCRHELKAPGDAFAHNDVRNLLELALTRLYPHYGLLWWLNRRGRIMAEAPVTGVCARGNATRQLLWIDPARELVVVARWTDGMGAVLRDLSAAIPVS